MKRRSRFECGPVAAAWLILFEYEVVVFAGTYVTDNGSMSEYLREVFLDQRTDISYEYWFPLHCEMLLIWEEVEL